jgi:hypothetical protein
VTNLGLWWGGGFLSDYARDYPATHFFVEDYEPQTLLKIKENIVSGAHRAVGLIAGGIISNIFNNKQDFKEVLEKSVQPRDHYLGLIRPGDYCIITSETSGEIWCQRVLKAGERDGIVYWGWPPERERPYLFTRLLPQLFLNPTNQPQASNTEALIQRHQIYWLKPLPLPRLQHQSGYFYEKKLRNTVSMSRAESVDLWTSRIQIYHQAQMVFMVLFFLVSPISLTIFYKDKLRSLFKGLQRKWNRWHNAKKQAEAKLILEPKAIQQQGGKMSEFIEEDDEGKGTGLVPKNYYPATASNPLMGAILSVGIRWKAGTEIKNIERLTELITVKTKLKGVTAQDIEAEKELVMKLAETGGITPKLIHKLESQGYYYLVKLLRQKEELQDLGHEEQKLTKQLEIEKKKRELRELQKPSKRRLSRREQEEREIKQIMTEAYGQFRKKVAHMDAVYGAATKAKEGARKRYQDNPKFLEEIERKIDFWKDNDTQFLGTEYEEDENRP